MGERDQEFILDSFRNRDAVENVGTVLRYKHLFTTKGTKKHEVLVGCGFV